METRSRKRAEATSTALPSSSGPTTRSGKRFRNTQSSATTGPTRTCVTRAHPSPMDPFTPVESASSSSRSRRNRSNNNESSSSDKGKAKEHEVRVRDRDNRSLKLDVENYNNPNEEDDDDSEGGIGAFHQNVTSASSALQGLLRKLGAGFDDLLPASGVPSSSSSLQHLSGRMKKILSGLQADGEEGKQVEALTQLCDILSIGTEESLSSFSVDIFVPVLVGLLSYERNSDIMLLAARAITHLCDVLPSSCGAVVHYGAIPFLVNRLVTIQYMDLAEQSLQALMKISVEHPTACLRAGALMAALSYLDFFSIGVQRIALSTAANMCKKIPSDASHFAMDAVPLLTSRLQYHDTKVLEQASVCLTRIAEAFASCPDRLDVLCNHGVVTEAASLISSSSSGGGQTSLSPPTYTGLIRLLSTCASGSPLGTKTLLHLGISGILKDILSGSSVSSNSPVPPALSRSAEQMFEIVNLANELLPPLPPGTVSIPAGTNNFVRGPIIKKSTSSNSGKQESSEGNVHQVSAREKLLKDHPELLKQFGMDLLPVMIQMYGSSVNSSVRHKCFSVIAKLMYFSNAEMIQSLISVTNISSFLAGVLAWKDAQVLVPALQIAEILMEKLPTTFSKIFVREGVLHAIDQLAVSGNPATNSVQSSLAEKDNDSLGVTSRSRRYKRRGDSAHKDGSSFEDSKNPIFGTCGSPPSSSEILMGHSNLRMHVGACAKAFKDKYFPLTAEVGVTEDLLYLKNLCAKLNAGVNDQKTKAKGKSKATGSHIMGSSASKEEYLIGIISEILTELSKGDGVSTFEFVGSGVVSALLNYLTCGFFSKERISEVNLPKLREQALKRFKLFISLALPSVNDEISATRMTILVQKLQNALTSLERFPVVLSQSSRSYGGSAPLSSGLGALAQTFKLRLCRAQGDKSLRDYSSNVVLIDPLASLAAVEQFLWPRVQRGESGQKSSASAGNSEAPTVAGGCSPSTSTPSSNIRRHSSRSKSSYGLGDTSKEPVPEKNASSLKGKGKAVVKATQEDAKGPQTRNATRRRAALVKEEQVKPENGDSSSEDEELDISLVEMDDAMIIEDDDISEEDDDDDNDDDHDDVLRDDSVPACMTDRVLDVKLGNPSEDSGDAPAISDTKTSLASGSSSRTAAVTGSDSVDFRIGSSYGSRGALSFAAATMSGLGSANGRGIRGERDRQGRSMFGSSNDPPKLIFTAGGKQLNRNLTIYQAVQRQLIEEEDDDQFTGGDFMANGGSRIWNDVYTITYQRADTQADGATAGATSSTTASKSKKGSSSSTSDGHSRRLSLLDSILQGELPCDLEKSNPTYNILALLRVLEGLNQLAPRLRMQMVSDNFVEGKTSSLDVLNCSGVKVSSEDFINTKLTTKLARQVQDALALCSGSVPPWCFQLTQACPFLFPFETRRQYFYSTAFGLSRALNRLQQQQGADGHASNNERELRVGRLQRQKVRLSRNRILDSALKVMEMYSSQKAVLEVEYFGEVGTGLGPTLEFYTLLSRDLQKLSLGMWRSNVSSGRASMDIDDEGKDGKSTKADLVEAPLGLFPQPWPPNADASEGSQYFKVIEYFRLVGRVMAKALQDGRLLDLPLSMAFYKLVLGQELDLFDILSFDMELGKVLQELHAIVVRKHYLESSGNDTKDAAADLSFHGASIEDLCFDFTLPGYPEYVLKPGNETVDINNLEEYVSLVVDATVKTGIMRQMEAFRDGFNQVFDISSLQIFSPEELDYLLCGRRELWEPETLVDYIKFDHGYTAKSPAIVNLLEIMGEFNPEQQRAFCQFVTGAPRLPPGGLAVLNPRLTIVRKLSSTAGNAMVNGSGGVSECADEDLPSVMTCANYLKLPPYSTKEIMFQKLVFAINEGQGSFDLS